MTIKSQTDNSLELSIMRSLGRMEGKQDMILSKVAAAESKLAKHEAILQDVQKKWAYGRGAVAVIAAMTTFAYAPIRETVLKWMGWAA